MTEQEKSELWEKLVNGLGTNVNELLSNEASIQDKVTIMVNAFADVQAQVFAQIAIKNGQAHDEGKRAFVIGCATAVKDATEQIAFKMIEKAKESPECSI